MSVADVALTPVLKNPMRIMKSDCIGTVKHRIQTCKSGVVVKKQKQLLFNGRSTNNTSTSLVIKDYGHDINVLHLILRVSDLHVMISFETAVIGKEFEFDRFRNVRDLKKLVLQKTTGVGFNDVEDYNILCDGVKLDDHRLIDDVCHNCDGVIHLIVRKSIDNVSVLDVRNCELERNFKKPPDIDSPLHAIIVNPSLKLSSAVWSMMDSAFQGLRKGKKPIRSCEGTGGTYFLQHPSGNRYVAIFKPIDEEPMAVNNPQGLPVSLNGEGLKRGTKVGEGAYREVAAYILDHPKSGPRICGDTEMGFAGVPPTVMAKCLNGEFNHPEGYDGGPHNVKLGSLQMFMKNCGSCEDMGPRDFPVEEVHKITVFDIRTANADRHAGNILMNLEGDRVVLIPIDHGYCLPENFEDCTFDWLYWPQAREPYSPETVDYIQTLDAERDLALLSSNGWNLSRECARTLRISTMLLKKGAKRGLCPYTIGRILCRETLNKESVMEKILQKAYNIMLPGTTEADFIAIVSGLLDFELDKVVLMGWHPHILSTSALAAKPRSVVVATTVVLVVMMMTASNADPQYSPFCQYARLKPLCNIMVRGATEYNEALKNAFRLTLVLNRRNTILLIPVITSLAKKADPSSSTNILKTCQEKLEDIKSYVKDLIAAVDENNKDMIEYYLRTGDITLRDCVDSITEVDIPEPPELSKLAKDVEDFKETALVIFLQAPIESVYNKPLPADYAG
ncbi:hypothetical protein QVD17_01903 [Tagetes erecta]|uniref:1-phosphatidylinositol 4-kinase n=1 Tax=Tagetes erecta TaxID=13708 RepID=A0AAD8P8J7_TARER|nr:hypothetical protein QVD17_01903 [Tagetes erecta]